MKKIDDKNIATDHDDGNRVQRPEQLRTFDVSFRKPIDEKTSNLSDVVPARPERLMIAKKIHLRRIFSETNRKHVNLSEGPCCPSSRTRETDCCPSSTRETMLSLLDQRDHDVVPPRPERPCCPSSTRETMLSLIDQRESERNRNDPSSQERNRNTLFRSGGTDATGSCRESRKAADLPPYTSKQTH